MTEEMTGIITPTVTATPSKAGVFSSKQAIRFLKPRLTPETHRDILGRLRFGKLFALPTVNRNTLFECLIVEQEIHQLDKYTSTRSHLTRCATQIHRSRSLCFFISMRFAQSGNFFYPPSQPGFSVQHGYKELPTSEQDGSPDEAASQMEAAIHHGGQNLM